MSAVETEKNARKPLASDPADKEHGAYVSYVMEVLGRISVGDYVDHVRVEQFQPSLLEAA